MPPPSSLTLNYDAVLTTTLFNYRKTLEDNISTGNVVFYMLKNKKERGYRVISDIGDRAAVPLMYELGRADTYSGYDVLDTSPTDGVTEAFWDWRQAAVPVAISRLEELKNRGEAKIIDLLDAKIKQAELGLQDLFGKMILQGNGKNNTSQIAQAYQSPANLSYGPDPIGLLVKYDPTSSTVIGNINQSTSTWWRNQFKNFSAATTYASFLKALRNLNNSCSKGPGGAPDLHIVDQATYELYEAALAAAHQNPSYQKADIPFDNIAFKGKPVVWDEFVPDVHNGTVAITKGSWFMLNLDFWEIQVQKDTNFANMPFVRPENQDAKVAQILWLGASCISNRRKQGVGGNIDTAIAA